MIDRLETYHVLTRDHHMNMTELMDMPPWMLDVKLLFIQRDLDEQAEKMRQQKNNLPAGLG